VNYKLGALILADLATAFDCLRLIVGVCCCAARAPGFYVPATLRRWRDMN
jgi:hypothetical protein